MVDLCLIHNDGSQRYTRLTPYPLQPSITRTNTSHHLSEEMTKIVALARAALVSNTLELKL